MVKGVVGLICKKKGILFSCLRNETMVDSIVSKGSSRCLFFISPAFFNTCRSVSDNLIIILTKNSQEQKGVAVLGIPLL